ncbi:hypothetical protein SNE40_022533 [Patella caerulea]|uniref:SEA domain-containing protein n=1 Tax=Patella caerulea TaxID=87958 RepID=A0AAN8GG71_PATCE
MSVKCNEQFNIKLTNKSTELYKLYEANFTVGLTNAFKGTPGFKVIEVLGFKEGSIICDYNAVFDLLKTNENTTKEINTTVLAKIINDIALLAPVDEKYTNEHIYALVSSDAVESLKNPCHNLCPDGSHCNKTSVTCHDNCEGYGCGQHGVCVLQHGRATCRCDETSDVIYSGEKCDEEIEKLLLPSNYIIIISCSIFGVIIIITIIIVIIIYKSRFDKKKPEVWHSRYSIENGSSEFERHEKSRMRQRPFNYEVMGDRHSYIDSLEQNTIGTRRSIVLEECNNADDVRVRDTACVSDQFKSNRRQVVLCYLTFILIRYQKMQHPICGHFQISVREMS